MLIPPDMIRVERGKEVTGGPETPARFHWCVLAYGICGVSRQPLSDACRQLIAQGVDARRAVGRFRAGRAEPDMVSTVGAAASVSTVEPDKGIVHFERYRPFGDRVRKVRGTTP
jgi:hypothetical protein